MRSEAPAELEALRTQADVARAEADELAGLRLAHGSLRAAHEQLEDELEALRAVRDERDELAGQLEQLARADRRRGERARRARRARSASCRSATTAAEDSQRAG